MRKELTDIDAALESYLARLAGDAVHTKAQKSEVVRVHYASPAAGIVLPAGQAAVTGALVGIAVGYVAYLAEWTKPLSWGIGAWLIVQCVAWLFMLGDWRSVLHKLEDVTRRDLNSDGVIGPVQSEPVVQTMRIELFDKDAKGAVTGGRYIELPCSDEQLLKLAEGLNSGTTLSQSNWTGRGRVFERAQFAEIQAELLKQGLAAWNSPGTPARGITLTASGRAVFRHIVDNPPTLAEDDY